jgi:hypothetical protein
LVTKKKRLVVGKRKNNSDIFAWLVMKHSTSFSASSFVDHSFQLPGAPMPEGGDEEVNIDKESI